MSLIIDSSVQDLAKESFSIDDERVGGIVSTSISLCVKDLVGAEFEYSVLLTDDDRIRELNSKWRDTDAATNVLAFPQVDWNDGEKTTQFGFILLGDVVVSLPTVLMQSRAEDKTPQAHLEHMIVHGTLHLLGFDHVKDDEAEVMEALEQRILKSI